MAELTRDDEPALHMTGISDTPGTKLSGPQGTTVDVARLSPDPSGSRTALIVVGMHRSGTSLATHLVSLFGLDLPRDDIGAQRGNVTGHWESQAVNNFNDWLFSKHDMGWSDFQQVPTIELDDEILSKFSATLQSGFGQVGDFVAKDPRISKLVPIWKEALTNLGIRQKYLHVIREPSEVAQSLSARDAIGIEQCSLLWLTSVLFSEFATRGQERAFVDYGGLIKDWRTNLMVAIDRIFPDRTLEASALREGDQIMDRSQKHYNRRPSDQTGFFGAGGWTDRAYRALQQLVVDPESEEAMLALDFIRSEFEAAAPFLTAFSETARASFDSVKAESAAAIQSQEYRHQGTTGRLEAEVLALKQALLIARDAAIGADTEAGQLRGRIVELEQTVLTYREVERNWESLFPEVDAKSQQLDEILNSRTWRLMWSVLTPYRQLRHRLSR